MSAGLTTLTHRIQNLILQADDFGLNEPVTRGIIHAFEQESSHQYLCHDNSLFFSSNDVLEKPPGAAKKRADSFQDRRMLGEKEIAPFDFGVHLNLTQGKPLTGDRYPAGLRP
ncbi:MAG: ChbG/HpnK family deacetylase [Planctomycetales bacterium]